MWKAHYVTPNVSPEGSDSCQSGSVCACSGDVTNHDPPLLFDISRDPAESWPLNPDNEALFEAVLCKMSVAMRKHRATITPAPRQLSVFKPSGNPGCSLAAVPLSLSAAARGRMREHDSHQGPGASHEVLRAGNVLATQSSLRVVYVPRGAP